MMLLIGWKYIMHLNQVQITKLIVSFPLIEAESNSMSSGSGSGGFFKYYLMVY